MATTVPSNQTAQPADASAVPAKSTEPLASLEEVDSGAPTTELQSPPAVVTAQSSVTRESIATAQRAAAIVDATVPAQIHDLRERMSFLSTFSPVVSTESPALPTVPVGPATTRVPEPIDRIPAADAVASVVAPPVVEKIYEPVQVAPEQGTPDLATTTTTPVPPDDQQARSSLGVSESGQMTADEKNAAIDRDVNTGAINPKNVTLDFLTDRVKKFFGSSGNQQQTSAAIPAAVVESVSTPTDQQLNPTEQSPNTVEQAIAEQQGNEQPAIVPEVTKQAEEPMIAATPPETV